jgi:hypothetical protein
MGSVDAITALVYPASEALLQCQKTSVLETLAWLYSDTPNYGWLCVYKSIYNSKSQY